jgi:hypothetical protein
MQKTNKMACIGQTLEKSLDKINNQGKRKGLELVYPLGQYIFSEDNANFEHPSKLEKISVSPYIKTLIDANKANTNDLIQDASDYIKSTGITKYIDLLNSNQEYLSLFKKENKTEQDVKDMKAIEKRMSHGNRYQKFENRKHLKPLIQLVFSHYYNSENIKNLETTNSVKEAYNIQKNFLEIGTERIGRKFNELALADYAINEVIKKYKQKRKEDPVQELRYEKKPNKFNEQRSLYYNTFPSAF